MVWSYLRKNMLSRHSRRNKLVKCYASRNSYQTRELTRQQTCLWSKLRSKLASLQPSDRVGNKASERPTQSLFHYGFRDVPRFHNWTRVIVLRFRVLVVVLPLCIAVVEHRLAWPFGFVSIRFAPHRLASRHRTMLSSHCHLAS